VGAVAKDYTPYRTGQISIITQPVSDSVAVGQTLTFTVVAYGPMLVYQWYFNGAKIISATSATLNIADAQLTNTGSYYVIVYNGGYQITSNTVLGIVTLH
jgi:hypothetical protein